MNSSPKYAGIHKVALALGLEVGVELTNSERKSSAGSGTDVLQASVLKHRGRFKDNQCTSV